MNKWIYIKSNNPADALALSSVIATSEKSFNIVRRSYVSLFLRGLNNVVIDFYTPVDDSNLLVIEEIESDSWNLKYDTIASLLEIETKGSYDPYCGFAKHIVDIERRLEAESLGLLYLFPHPDQNLDLVLIDNLARLLESHGIKSISGGTCMLPCIKGTFDLRGIVDFAVLCALLPKIQFVITTEKSVATICEAFNKKGFVVSNIDKLTVDGISMMDANQILNYIILKTKNI
jgi:hypothetical protein